jgi:hypothetical protein
MLAMTVAHPKAVHIVFAIMAEPAFAVLVAQAYLKVLYCPIYELTQFVIQGYEHREAKRPGSLATRFQAAAAASTMAS